MGGSDYRRTGPEDFESYVASTKPDHKSGMSRSRLTIKGSKDFNYERPRSVNWSRNRFLYAVQLMSRGCCMFVTESRRIGTGPSRILAGDRIAILPGSPVPVALRTSKSKGCIEANVKNLVPKFPQTETPSEWACKEVHECYKVVGDFYISGVMDGESVTGRLNQIATLYLE
jgi:hypothetical protein